jgi:cysteine-rich repeat protein
VPLCGDGVLRGGETCDDRDAVSGDGCSFACQSEVGFTCAGEPSNCVAICGDGFRRGLETCDDANLIDEDGCSGSFCREEVGYSCLGQPSVCVANCGNGNLDDDEECDDGDLDDGDGCDAVCGGEPGWSCGGEPSVCVLSCGNGAIEGAETCDDGNIVARDGCSASCRNESGWYCGTPGLPCQPFEIFIDGPAHGTFTTSATTLINGHYTTLPAGVTAITVNGTPASSVNTATRTFSHTVTLNGAAVLNPIRVTLTNTANGNAVDDRVVVIAGPSVADGALSPESVALRMNDTGIDAIEPLVSDLAAGEFDFATLVPSGTVILPWQCYFQFIWCWAGAEARIGSPAPSFGAVHFAADSRTDAVDADIVLDNLRIDIDIDGTGLAPDCGLRLTASHLNISGDYTLAPDGSDPSQVDVNLAALTSVSFDGFQRSFTYGNCSLVEGQLGNVEELAQDAITGFIDDPDGSGPEDSPLADAIEDALGGVSIAGAVGSGLGLDLDAPLFDVIEDPAGITLGADASFTVSVGSGPGQCLPPPGAPDLVASYAPPEIFPSFGATTPVGGVPYDVGVSISTAGLNQLMRGQTECGLMRTSLTSIDIDGEGGVPPVAITAPLLALLVPEFAQLPPPRRSASTSHPLSRRSSPATPVPAASPSISRSATSWSTSWSRGRAPG